MNNLIILSGLIVIILLLSFFFYKKNEAFVVTTNSINSITQKPIGEVYTYPCIGCLTNNNKLKPGFMYNITDDRCIKNSSTNYIDSNTEILNLQNYNSLPNINFNSCSNIYNSTYSSVNGRYVMIYRTDTIKMKFSHISVHDRDRTKPPLSLNATIYTTFLEKNESGNYIYPETVLNSSTNLITFTSGAKQNEIPSVTVITLPNSVNIGYIEIRHNNNIDAATLNGAILSILSDTRSQTDPNNATVVFQTTINTNELNRIIYTYNHLNTPLPISLSNQMPIVNKWFIPCDNCGTMNNTLFLDHYYSNTQDIRCYKPTVANLDRSLLDSQNIDPLLLNTSFQSCSLTFDTRYLPANGKFIQLSRNDKSIIISKLRLYSDYFNGTHNIDSLSSFAALVTTYLNDTSLFGNALDESETTLLSTTTSNASKIFIDLGPNNKTISGIGLKIPISERYNIIGLKINIIKIDESDPFNISKMNVTCERTITANDIINTPVEPGDTNSYTYLISLSNNIDAPVSSRPDIIINNRVNYNSTNKYLTTYKKNQIFYQIPYTIYTMSNGRSVMAKTLTDSSETLDKINMSDAVTLFNFSSNTDMASEPNIVKSYLLNPISARYIQIAPVSGQILSIELFDSDKTSIKLINNPKIIYTLPESTYTSYLSDSNVGAIGPGFILIDIGSNTLITFIKITTSVSIQNSVLTLVNNNNNRVFSYTITNTGTTIYLITDNNKITETVPFLVNKYAYPTCLNNGLCNTIAPNTYYILNDERCFKSNTSVDPNTCGNCMDQLSQFSRTNQIDSILNNFGSCLSSIDTTDITIEPGLEWRKYNGYFNDDLNFFKTTGVINSGTGVVDGTNLATLTNNIEYPNGGEYYSIQWIGYFRTAAAGTYTFTMLSDDASYMWLGNVAITGYTTSNTLTQAPGQHPVLGQTSSITLEAGKMYPIRIMFGEATGGDDIQISFSGPGISTTYNFNNYWFSKPSSAFW